MSFIDYLRLRTPQLRHLAGGGDDSAKQEIARRQRDAPAPTDVTRLEYLELRAIVRGWQTGETAEDRGQSRIKAEAAQLELEARFRVRGRLGWRDEDAHVFGPPDIDALPAPPWLAAPAPSTRSWRRPTSSTHYRGAADIQRDGLRAMASRIYADLAAGVPQK